MEEDTGAELVWRCMTLPEQLREKGFDDNMALFTTQGLLFFLQNRPSRIAEEECLWRLAYVDEAVRLLELLGWERRIVDDVACFDRVQAPEKENDIIEILHEQSSLLMESISPERHYDRSNNLQPSETWFSRLQTIIRGRPVEGKNLVAFLRTVVGKLMLMNKDERMIYVATLLPTRYIPDYIGVGHLDLPNRFVFHPSLQPSKEYLENKWMQLQQGKWKVDNFSDDWSSYDVVPGLKRYLKHFSDFIALGHQRQERLQQSQLELEKLKDRSIHLREYFFPFNPESNGQWAQVLLDRYPTTMAVYITVSRYLSAPTFVYAAEVCTQCAQHESNDASLRTLLRLQGICLYLLGQDTLGECVARCNIAGEFDALELEATTRHAVLAIELAKVVQQPSLLISGQYHLQQNLMKRGEMGVIEVQEEILNLAKEQGTGQMAMLSVLKADLAYAYKIIGDQKQATRRQKEAVAALKGEMRANPPVPQLLHFIAKLCEDFLNQGRLKKAKRWLQRGLSLCERAGAEGVEEREVYFAIYWSFWATFYGKKWEKAMKATQRKKAQERLRERVRLYEGKLLDSPGCTVLQRYNLMVGRRDRAQEKNRFAKQIKRTHQIRTLAIELNLTHRVAQSYAYEAFYRFANLSPKSDEVAPILELCVKAKAIYDQLWAGMIHDQHKLWQLEQELEAHQIHQGALLRQKGGAIPAIEVSEGVRARALVEYLSISSEGLPQQKLFSASNLTDIVRRRQVTVIEFSVIGHPVLNIVAWLVTPDGLFYARSSQIQDAALKELLKFGVHNTNSSLKRNMEPEDGEKEAEESTRISSATKRKLRELYDLLIKPLKMGSSAQQVTDKLVIVPQGILFYVPWAALLDETEKPLVSRFEVSVVPSIVSMHLLSLRQAGYQKGGTEEDTRASVVVGNPTMPQFEGVRLPRLPGAEEEAIEVAEQLKSTYLTGDRATKAAVKRRMADAPITHFATHSVQALPDSEYLSGAIALAPDFDAEGKDDGWAYASDINTWTTHARLVVLSCCQTGQGQLQAAGAAGLSRAFLLAGASSVVVSLWPVEDEGTRKLMKLFYSHLLEESEETVGGETRPTIKWKLSSCAALQRAMLEMINEGWPPEVWASFIVIGV